MIFKTLKVIKDVAGVPYATITFAELMYGSVPTLFQEKVTMEYLHTVFPDIDFTNVKLVNIELNEAN